ncbi:MAG: YgiT-type zinc finger protein [Chloroflexi bacterium]|nr:YgiT-type zinc finger protein [Chloroflexota bacterium]
MKKCLNCRGPVEPRRIEHVHRWKGQLCIFGDVSAEVCTQCGEVFFSPPSLKAMDNVTTQDREPNDHRSAPMYSLLG